MEKAEITRSGGRCQCKRGQFWNGLILLLLPSSNILGKFWRGSGATPAGGLIQYADQLFACRRNCNLTLANNLLGS